jgi:hypothetical protein
MKELGKLADAIAAQWRGKLQASSWDRLRDAIDLETGGELDCQPLDILTDMVAKRLGLAF